jgi:hypothetical protein
MTKIFAALAAACLLSGCATITRGTSNHVQIISDPAGADVRTSTNQSCRTPCTLTVSRKDEFFVTVTKDGYREESVQVKTQVAGAGAAGMAGNVIFGGVIGIGTDVVTGAAYEHVPNPVNVALQKLEPEVAVTAGTKPARGAKPAAKPQPKRADEMPGS